MFEILEPFQSLIKKFESPKISTERQPTHLVSLHFIHPPKKPWTQDGVPNLMFYMHIISLKITGLLHELNHYPPWFLCRGGHQTNMHKSCAYVLTLVISNWWPCLYQTILTVKLLAILFTVKHFLPIEQYFLW